ncbi:MAG: Gfo/Idh/MocA family oxidoreductase [Nitrospirota bacterium]|nr:Gfo/Idh/MocA family oxidoreductase [Nitrospirota bacterium]
MGTLKVGVIGVGHLGQHHARIYSELPQTRLVGVVDSDQDRAAEISQRFGVSHDAHWRKLLGQVEAVSVAVPTSKHREVVGACLSAGVHVLVEKPLASSLEEGRDMVQLANHKGVILQVGHVERFNPVRDLVQDIIHKPGFIECHRLAPFQLRGTDVDVVLDLMIHDVDLILSFGLGQVNKVEAVGVAVLSQQVDFANARVEFSEGCIVNFTASRISTGRLRKMRLFQTNLYLSVDYQSRQGIVYRQQALATAEPSVIEESIQAGEEEPLKRELEAFVQSIQTGKSHGVSGEEGLAALELAHSIIYSIHGTPLPTAGLSNIAVPFM